MNFDQAINELKGYATDGETLFRTLKEPRTSFAFKIVTAKVIDHVLRVKVKFNRSHLKLMIKMATR
ncbi:hypothetical protein [Candidatus Williamhamiltonella defendens]|uniref:hypothetical protein n=1 Tax=Candidatus Williamhamiltonella defendens TaxID=138072 RepID=UPI001F3B3E28|nr:hypothetical protein [Candidatus Hamiltonella defensa]